MKYVLFKIVNSINKLQEIVEGSEKTSACFKMGNYKKIFFIENLYGNPNKRGKIEFS